MYHQIMSNPDSAYRKYTVTARTFSMQMTILKLLGFMTINFNDLVDYKYGRKNLPSKPIIITFDDGYVGAIENSVPILRALGFRAVFYIPTDFVGRMSNWDLLKLGVGFPIVDWATIKKLDEDGFQIGCHSMTHPFLNELSSEDCINELKYSRATLEEHLGHSVDHLAYPFGSVDEKVRAIAAELGYRTACSIDSGFVNSEADILELPRINIKGQDSLLDFLAKVHTATNWETLQKRAIRKIEKFSTKIKNIRG